jgi:NitT/TauT family transport system permease protein
MDSPGVSRARATRRWLSPMVWLPAVVVLVGLGFVWNVIANHNPYVLPSLGAVWDALRADPSFYLRNAGTTLLEALAGLACAFVLATVLAVLAAEFPPLRRAIMPIAVVLNVTPVVAIAPALVVAFGFGSTPKIVVTALITFFPLLINMFAGLRAVDRDALDVLRSVDASRTDVLWRLRVPSSLPFVFAALRVCLPLSVVGAVVAEFVSAGSAQGLGTAITVASSNSNLPVVYAAILCLALIGVGLWVIVTVAERRVLAWRVLQPVEPWQPRE